MVSQNPFLFDISVQENIEIGKSKYTNHSIEEAAQASNSMEFIEEFPMKFGERLGEKATRVSGGQLQRLALARAFYRNSPILILDEATSALDTVNEAAVLRAIEDVHKHQAVGMLVIAHR